MQKSRKLVVFAAASAIAGLSQAARAATTQTWKNSGTNFNLGTSWVSGTAPGTGDSALFPNNAPGTNPTLSGSISLSNITFAGANSAGYTLAASSPFALTLTSTSTTGGAAIFAGNTSGSNTISAPIILGQAGAANAKFTQSAGGTLTVSGAISSSNSPVFIVSGGGTVSLSGNNTYTGTTQVSAATLNINNASALGGSTVTSTGNGTFIDNTSGGALTLSNAMSLSTRDLTFIGTNGANSSLTFNGGLFIAAGQHPAMNVTTPGAKLTFANVNYSSGRLEQATGTGLLVISGASTGGTGLADTLGGVTYNDVAGLLSTGGSLEVDNALAFGTASATSNVVKFTNGGIQAGPGIGAIANTFVIATGSPTVGGTNNIEFSGDFILNNNAGPNSRTVFVTNTAGTKWSGTISLSDAGGDTDNVLTFDVASTAGPTEVSGVIRDTNTGAGNNGIIKQNSGTLLLSGANSYTGTTAVRAGTLQLTGSLASPLVTLGNSLNSGRLVLGGSGGAVNLNLTSLTAVGTGTTNVIVGGNSADSTNSVVTINPAVDQPYGGGFGGTGANENKIALTKNGTTAFTVSGPNNTIMAGPVNVNGGTLSFGGNNVGTTASTGAITVSDNATLSAKVNLVSSTRLTSTGLTLGSAGNANINFDFGGLTNPTAPIISTGAIAVNGTAVTLTAANATALTAGTFTILDYTGSLSPSDFAKFSPTVSLGGRASGAVSNDVSNSSLDLTVTIAKPTWNGNITGGVWDKDTVGDDSTGTKNWQISAVSTCYREPTVPGDSVIFDDSASGTTTVNLTTTVSPASVTMNNSSKDYTFTGTGSIAGGTGLTKSGTGKLTIDNLNTYTGATTVGAGGTIEFTSNGQIAGALVLNSAVANLNGTGSGAVLGAVTANSSSAVKLLSATAIPGGITLTDSALDLNGFSPTLGSLNGIGVSTISNSAAGAAALTISGTGTYTYTGAINDGAGTVALSKTVGGQLLLGGTSNYSGGTSINVGSIQVNSNSGLGSGTVAVNSGQLVLGNGASVGNALVMNSGAGVSGQGILQAAAATDVTYGGAITINGTWGTNSGHFGGGAGSTLTLTGPITSSVMVGVRSGTIIFAAPGSSYTDIGSSVASGGSAIIKLGATNGISTTATLNHDQIPTFDLAGFSQTLVGMTGTSSGAATTNTVTGTSTLTITGFSDWKGHMQDGGPSALLALVVNNPGFNFIMENSNTYTGGTTLVNGQITANQAANPIGGNANLATINGGVFDIEASTTIDSLAVNGGIVTSSAIRTLTFGGDNVSRTYAGTFTNSAGLFSIQKNGTGTTTMTAANSYTGSTSANGGKLFFAQSQTATSAINASGGTIELAAAADPTIATNLFKAQTMSASSGGKVDLQNNKAILTATTYAAVEPLLLSGRNGGSWDGTNGIVTSQASAAAGLTAIGAALNSDLLAPKSTFGGVSVASTDVLLMYTYDGDATLDGTISGDDYFQIDNGFENHLPATWANGDFNYDGKINADDYFIIDHNYARQTLGTFANAPTMPGAPLEGVSAVPEPASLSVLGVAAAGLMRRRRRQA